MPPSCAIATAIGAVVTVSMLAEHDRHLELDPRREASSGSRRPGASARASGAARAGRRRRSGRCGSRSRRHLQRNDLEAVDVDEPAVGDLQRRDHREREERERQERRRARPAERGRGLVRGEALRDHVGERGVGEEAGDRERALGDDAAVVDHDDAAADLGEVR